MDVIQVQGAAASIASLSFDDVSIFVMTVVGIIGVLLWWESDQA